MREIELKITLDAEQEKRLRAAPVIRELAEEGAQVENLLSLYFDTKSHDLRAAGIALRLRRAESRWIQTVKHVSAPMVQGLSTPVEDECELRAQQLALGLIGDDDLREEVIGLARTGLEPVAETKFRRIKRILRLPNGSRVELCIDKGELGAGEHTTPLLEAELELIKGTPADLYDLARMLFREGPIRFSEQSKSERAIALGTAGEPDPPSLRKARPVALKRSLTAESAAVTILNEGLSHFLPNLALLLDSDTPSGPHQVRVSLRRLRSALSAFRPVLGRETLDPWAAQAREIAAEAGQIRDLDVLIDDLVVPLSEKLPAEGGFVPLLKTLCARRVETREAVRMRLAGPEVTGFGFGLAAFLAGRRWLDPTDLGQTARLARPIGKFAGKIITKRWRAVVQYGDRIEALTIDERHEMRKELKKLRYMVDAFRSLYAEEDWQVFMRGVKPLQKAFGALNDQAMAEMMLTGEDMVEIDDPAAHRAIGRLLGYLQHEDSRLWPNAVSGWASLSKQRRFWE